MLTTAGRGTGGRAAEESGVAGWRCMMVVVVMVGKKGVVGHRPALYTGIPGRSAHVGRERCSCHEIVRPLVSCGGLRQLRVVDPKSSSETWSVTVRHSETPNSHSTSAFVGRAIAPWCSSCWCCYSRYAELHGRRRVDLRA